MSQQRHKVRDYCLSSQKLRAHTDDYKKLSINILPTTTTTTTTILEFFYFFFENQKGTLNKEQEKKGSAI